MNDSGIDVWLAPDGTQMDSVLLDRLGSLMSEDERQRETRYRFAADQRRFRVTRALVRLVLSRYVPLLPSAWSFCTNPHGRPQIDSVHQAAQGLRFNVSHTQGLIALGVSRRHELGVDVESLHGRRTPLHLAKRFFAADEVAALAALEPRQQHERFFGYWTLKESYLKARGVGLLIPLSQVSFDLSGGEGVRFALDPALGDRAGRWHFVQYRPTSGHLLAVCAERLDLSIPDVRIHTVVPALVDETCVLLPQGLTRGVSIGESPFIPEVTSLFEPDHARR